MTDRQQGKSKVTDADREKYGGLFKQQQKRDSNGKCIPKHAAWVAPSNPESPARQIIKDLSKARDIFEVKDAEGNIVLLSAPWIVGFTDGEGTLGWECQKNSSLTYGYQIQSSYVIVQGEQDWLLLTAIANFFGDGSVTMNRSDSTSVRYQYRTKSCDLIATLFIPFFDAVPPLSKKAAQYVYWKTWNVFMYERKHRNNWPTNMVILLEGIKESFLLGTPNDKSIGSLKTFDACIEAVKKSPLPKEETTFS